MKNKTPYIILGLIVITGITLFSINKNTQLIKNDSNTIAVESHFVDLKNGETFDLTASYITKDIKGTKQTMLAYNGSIPGPTIRVAQGSEVTINFKNNTDIPQLLHSHGVRMDNAYDGSQMVQKEMKPGESFSYKLKFPDAGIYWYHPHVQEVYGQGLGLYGAFIVTPSDPTYFSKVNREIPLFLSDIPIENGAIALDKSKTSHTLMGHYGNVLLINGQENFSLNAKAGEVVRLNIVNSANVRPFNFTIPNVKMKLIGSDNGAYEKESFVENVLLAPSERAIVDVYFSKPGNYDLQNVTPNRIYILGKVVVDNNKAENSYFSEFNKIHTNTNVVKSIAKYSNYFDKTPDKKLKLTIDMNMKSRNSGGMMGRRNGEEETVNLMGMNMTKEQAIEHCKMMPEMQGCEPYLTGETSTVDDGIEWEDNMEMMNQKMTVKNTKW